VNVEHIFDASIVACVSIQYVWAVSYTVFFPLHRSENVVGVNNGKENLPEWLGKILDSAVAGLAVFDGL
ncbi:hypothetical protein, partial [Photobacterium halotolerans]|uniref:hypothetical protein n=1 Tax=Photobacterium halotolerans TaxID=265726 RepID=UPI001F1B3232